jgi:hypothetical protein
MHTCTMQSTGSWWRRSQVGWGRVCSALLVGRQAGRAGQAAASGSPVRPTTALHTSPRRCLLPAAPGRCLPACRSRVVGSERERAPPRHRLCHRQQRQQGQAVGPADENLRAGGWWGQPVCVAPCVFVECVCCDLACLDAVDSCGSGSGKSSSPGLMHQLPCRHSMPSPA